MRVSAPNDPSERDADRIADLVLGKSAHSSAEAPGPAGHPLQRGVDGESGSAPPHVVRDGGSALPARVRSFFEPRFGRDLSSVRVHSDDRAASSARSVGALAYTVGQDVIFGSGHYAPDTAIGRRLLAHELAHVIQQGGAQLGRQPEPDCGCSTGQPERAIPVPSLLQRNGVPSGTAGEIAPSASIHHVLNTPGQQLDAGTRAVLEPRFGQDFSGVRVHSDPAAGRSAQSIGARAYTVGSHVVFGAGEYRSGTADGRHLLAHELAHVVQQRTRRDLRGGVIQRDDKVQPRETAAGSPKLDFRPAKNPPPCACIVFIHHDEPNARLTAQLMHEFCHYNLAIVDPQTVARTIKLPGNGDIDPNELFPRNVAEECWADDKPCEHFLKKNAGATNAAVVEEFAQRRFFLAVKQCSAGFSLPVVGLHNNSIEDTARYRAAVRDPKAPLDVWPIRGKTFDDALKAGDKPKEANTLPFADLEDWLLRNVPGVEAKKAATGAKGTLTTPTSPNIFTKKKTNIFLWCSAKDISRCQIGDPERPDNVVWVTNTADFDKLRGTKTNVVLQTRVDPAGTSATDLSSLFVFLKEIMASHFSALIIKLESDVAVEASAVANAIRELRELQRYNDLTLGNALDQLRKIVERIIELLTRLLLVAAANGTRAVKLSQLRFVNVETPQTPADATTKPEDLRVQSYRDVKATLATLGLDCCDAKPAEGQTQSAVEKIEQALRQGRLPKT
jgi:hypothetical protein